MVTQRLVDFTPEQRGAINHILLRHDLTEFQQYVEEIMVHPAPEMVIRLINAVYEKAIQDMRYRAQELEHMKLSQIVGGLNRCSHG